MREAAYYIRNRYNLKYVEIDYSKTRLIQKQKKDAAIEVVKLGDKTMVRMPATEKAESFFNAIVGKLRTKSGVKFQSEGIELPSSLDAKGRTQFFFDLITKLRGYDFVTVTSLRVTRISSGSQADEDSEELDADDDSADAEMLNAVKSVILQGTKLELSTEYKSLRKRGYYIYGIKWHSDQQLAPLHRVQFEALFGDEEECRDFKYAALCSPQPEKEDQSYHFKQPKEGEKRAMFQVVEEAARKILADMAEDEGDKDVKGEADEEEAA